MLWCDVFSFQVAVQSCTWSSPRIKYLSSLSLSPEFSFSFFFPPPAFQISESKRCGRVISWMVTTLSVSPRLSWKSCKTRSLFDCREQIQTCKHPCTSPPSWSGLFSALNILNLPSSRLQKPQNASDLLSQPLTRFQTAFYPNCCLLRNNDHRVRGLQMQLFTDEQ